MNFLKFFRQESDVSASSIIITAIVAAIAESCVLGIIIAVANTATIKSLNFQFLMMYFVALAIALIGKKYTYGRSTALTENMIQKIRMRIAEKIRKCELLFIENIGIASLYTQITQNTSLISLFALLMIGGVQCCVIVFFCLIYIAFLSKLAFFVTITSVLLIGLMYVIQDKIFSDDYKRSIENETKFCEMLNDTLSGFKELKMHKRRNQEHLEEFANIINESETFNIRTQTSFINKTLNTQLLFYFLLAAVGFLMPRLGAGYSDLIMQITAAILFIMGPINMIVSAIPQFFKVNAAIGTLYHLEQTLEGAMTTVQGFKRKIKPFEDICFDDVVFHYRDVDETPVFTTGPLNLSIKKGETVFIVGGNGSGKTTMMKLLAGLYLPSSGSIKIDGNLVNRPLYSAYRELFSTIFSDFHLFDKLYGIDESEYDKANDLIALMELDSKTYVSNGEFATTKLSTGQRKRLAMVVALLENRPICLFDEWAADQDPTFKDYFYQTLLADLKKEGKTVVAISHDDRYFHHADRVLKMEFGEIIDESC